MKIYTKTGDNGETGYLGGRIAKDSLLIDTIGEIDELNSVIGMVLSLDIQELSRQLISIQTQLFSIGAMLADKDQQLKTIYPIDEWIMQLEQIIDNWEEKLLPLQNFILPGGSQAAAHLHLARSVCRRVERQMIRYNKTLVQPYSVVQKYCNRLSDYLFVAARYANKLAGVDDVLWSGE